MKSKLTDDDIHATLVAKVAIKPSAPSKKGAPSVQLEKRTQSKRPKGSKSGITKKNIKSVSARSGTNRKKRFYFSSMLRRNLRNLSASFPTKYTGYLKTSLELTLTL